MRKQNSAPTPTLILVAGTQLSELEHRDDLFDDFCLTPFHPSELEARLRHLLSSDVEVQSADVVEYGSLALNLETYQAAVEQGYVGSLLALGAILNLIAFFAFLKIRRDYRARGVLMATVLTALIILFYKLS